VIGLVQAAITLVMFLVILGGIVLIHDLGHFVTARLADVRVLEFGIGFPPRAKVIGVGKPHPDDLARPIVAPALPPGMAPGSAEAEQFLAAAAASATARRQGTLYTLNWLPIGGFVKLEGEDGGDSADPRSFQNAWLPVKLIILVAGVTMNLLLAFVIFTGIAMTGEPAVGVRFGVVAPDSPAAQAGLVPGDVVVAVNGQRHSAFSGQTPVQDLNANAGKPVTLTIQHADGTTQDVQVTLRVPSGAEQGALGIGELKGTPVGTITHTVGDAVQLGVQRTAEAFTLIIGGLADLGRSIVTNPTAPPPASGPVGIAVTMGDVLWGLGPLYVLYMAGLLSANLALVNALPFPPLDGGRMLVILLKAIPRYGTRISVRAERLTYAVGFVALFTFLIWITVFDIGHSVFPQTP